MAKRPRLDDEEPVEHSFRETRDLKPRDQALRSHGYRIRSRPKIGPAIWSLGSILYTESEALEACGYTEAKTCET